MLGSHLVFHKNWTVVFQNPRRDTKRKSFEHATFRILMEHHFRPGDIAVPANYAYSVSKTNIVLVMLTDQYYRRSICCTKKSLVHWNPHKTLVFDPIEHYKPSYRGRYVKFCTKKEQNLHSFEPKQQYFTRNARHEDVREMFCSTTNPFGELTTYTKWYTNCFEASYFARISCIIILHMPLEGFIFMI